MCTLQWLSRELTLVARQVIWLGMGVEQRLPCLVTILVLGCLLTPVLYALLSAAPMKAPCPFALFPAPT